MQIVVRMLRAEDIKPLARIEAETFSMPWSENAFRELLERPYCSYFVALAEDQVVGGAGCINLCGEMNIDNVVVAQSHRNQGIGQLLLQELIAAGEKEGVRAFTLEVRVSNAAAIHLYEKNGFRSEGIRPRFYEKPTEDAMIMWRRQETAEESPEPENVRFYGF